MSDSKNIHECEYCDKLYCVTCSDADNPEKYCSIDCECSAADRMREIMVERAERQRDFEDGIRGCIG